MDPSTDELAQTLWNYMLMGQPVDPHTDLILVFGSNDLRVAEHAAALYHALSLSSSSPPPKVLFSGGSGRLTAGVFHQSEAELFAQVAERQGVPSSAILLESKSTNSGENVLFSREILAAAGLDPQCITLVQKPYMERRALATLLRFWPEKAASVTVTSPPLTMEAYPADGIADKALMVSVLVGDVQRVRVYNKRGFQTAMEMPAMVWDAMLLLAARGFDTHVLRDAHGGIAVE